MGELLGEIFGTVVLIPLGDGVIANVGCPADASPPRRYTDASAAQRSEASV